MPDWIHAIRRKLAIAQEHEASAANWSEISYAMNPPIGPAELESLELTHRLTLPEDYRRFLLEVADGGAGPGYGLYSLAHALEERGPGVWGLDDPFEPPIDRGDAIDLRAPGMLLLNHDGCSFYGGLAVSGPVAGTVWAYVEVDPGWIPSVEGELVGPDGAPFDLRGSEVADYQEWYEVMLSARNRARWQSFASWYGTWLDGVISQATAS